jgi:hypothetical protein
MKAIAMHWVPAMKKKNPAHNRRHPIIETLEGRALLASPNDLMVSFYGLNGAGDFAADWQDKVVTAAAAATGSTARRYDVGQRGQALRATLASIDTNHNRRIDQQEVAGLDLRVIGLSYGGIEAINFARSLSGAGTVIDGYTLDVAVPVKALVTLDPVEGPSEHTRGVSRNVVYYTNYYQQRGGDARVDLFSQQTGAREGALTVADPWSVTGQAIRSAARTSRQARLDVGPNGEKIVMHEVQPGMNGKIRGKNLNHLALPFYAYARAVRDLSRA